MKVIWHETTSAINIFYGGDCLVLTKSHPSYQKVKEWVQENQEDKIKHFILSQNNSKNINIVESLLGVKKSD